jgi:hypothetical protein
MACLVEREFKIAFVLNNVFWLLLVQDTHVGYVVDNLRGYSKQMLFFLDNTLYQLCIALLDTEG